MGDKTAECTAAVLYKVEPRELGSLAADVLVDALPGLESAVPRQMRLTFGGG